MQITRISSTNLRQIQSEMEAAVQQVASKYGLKIQSAGGNYAPTEATVKFYVQTSNHGHVGADPQQDSLNAMLLNSYNLPADAIGRTFSQNGKTFTIQRIDHRKPKFPVIAACSDGKTYKFTVEFVRRQLV